MPTDSAATTDQPLDAPASAGRGSTRWQAGVRLALLVGAIAILAIVAVGVGPDVQSIRNWTGGGGWFAAIAFVLLYAGLTVAMVPGVVLTLAAGLLFGAATGSLVTVVGATLGATVAFSIARATGRDAVVRLASDRATRVDDWLGDRGLLAVITLRLVPLVPFSAANYAAGLTAVHRRHFVVGTAVGIVPGTVVYTVLGDRAADPTDPLFLGAMAGLALLAVLGGMAMRRDRRLAAPPAAATARSAVRSSRTR